LRWRQIFSHTATFALLYMTVIVLVTTGNSTAGIGLADSSPPSAWTTFSPRRASVRINAEDVVAVAAFAMAGMVIGDFAAREHAGSLRATVVCCRPVKWL
jgi:hypothetical protein